MGKNIAEEILEFHLKFLRFNSGEITFDNLVLKKVSIIYLKYIKNSLRNFIKSALSFTFSKL